MKKDREVLEKYLLHECEKIALNAKKTSEVVDYMYEKYEIPTGTATDMIARAKLAEQTEYVLFCLLDGIIQITNDKNVLESFFTEIEIENFSKMKLPKDEIKFPLVIPCIQVADDQWIGATDTNFFMDLRRAQMINYNINAQRALTRVMTRNGEQWKITQNEKTITGIRKSLQKEEYIPTAITLNIPPEEFDFYYDKEQRALVIGSLKYFDISDGYHRYVSMCREKDMNPDVNYPWELRIVKFSEDKAKYFVYQESQKTEMKKIDEKAMYSYGVANRVAQDLNKDTSFRLFGEINNTGGKLSRSEFIKVLDYFFCQGSEGTNENQLYFEVMQKVKNKFNSLIMSNIDYGMKKYSYVDMLITLYVFSRIDDANKFEKYISGITTRIDRINKAKLQPAKKLGKTLTNDLDKLFEEVQ